MPISSRRRSSETKFPTATCAALWRWLRRRGAEVGWRAAVDSLRPHSHALWQSLDGEQQRRFLRHARPWWDVHRHRIAPEVARDGRAADRRGPAGDRRRPDRLGARDAATALEVDFRRRGAGQPQTRDASPMRSTAPGRCIRSRGRSDPLLRSLLDAGQVRPDQLGIGLEVDERSPRRANVCGRWGR